MKPSPYCRPKLVEEPIRRRYPDRRYMVPRPQGTVTPKWITEPIFPNEAEPIAQEILYELLTNERVFQSALCEMYPFVSVQNATKKLCRDRHNIKVENLGPDDACYYLIEPPDSLTYRQARDAFLTAFGNRKRKNDGGSR